MSSVIDTLKSHLRSYAKIDDELKDLNKQIYELRSKKQNIEEELLPILKSPDFTHINKIQLSEDNSVVRIQRPGGWNKAWTISQKDLESSINEYFRSTETPQADECFQYIVEHQRKKLVSNDFNFIRVKND